jgi:hypothetical protein
MTAEPPEAKPAFDLSSARPYKDRRQGASIMKLGFEEAQTPYKSGSQSARAWTEKWVHNWVYCPNCGSPKINTFPNNSPVADFFALLAKKNTS